MPFVIDSRVIEAIRQHVEADAPHEAVGILGGGEDVSAVVPLANAASDRRCSFRVTRDEHERATRSLAALGLRNLGVYHSHVGGRAVPSLEDRRWLPPGLWLIAAVRGRRMSEVRAFRALGEVVRELHVTFRTGETP